MRRIIFLALLAVLACAFSACADVQVYRGAGSIGSVPSLENASGLCVPVEDVARIMGFSVRRSGEEVFMLRGSSQLKLILKSAAAWRGLAIVPLYSAPFEQGGKVWLDSQSAVSLFQAFAGRGQNSRLRFVKGAAQPAPAIVAAEAPEPPKPAATATVAQAPAKPAKTATVAQTTAKPAQTVAASQAPAKPAETATMEDIDLRLKELDEALRLDNAPKNDAPVIDVRPKAPAQPQTTKPSATASKPSGKAQPKLETFKPGDAKAEKRETYSGTIQRIRWTYSEGNSTKKVKAVIEANEGADPQVFMVGGNVHALFEGAADSVEGLTSPYTNMTVTLNRNDSGVELIFSPTGITKAEKLVLSNPRRIAFDFFYPESVIVSPASAQQTPAVRTPTQTRVQIPEIVPQPLPTTPRSPAVTTPPSTITIPTSAAGAARLRAGRKTVVIDPGHGGKDPGASANGVMEKNVNLAVGLELNRVLGARGYNVVMTRNTDVYLTLQERTDIANRVNADLFVSVHVNALPNKKSMTGFEIYIMALPTDKDAMNLAKIENREYIEGKGMDTANVDRRTEMLLKILGDMQQNNKISESTDFAAALYNAGVLGGLPMRRIAQAPFFVLRGAGMPAVLLEIGFVTNQTESQLLTTPAYQQKIAEAMAAGIVNYLK
ncbi:MAG: N-acetylmuramoyl-L-alanine amidase [Synergistaceae bacterium]|nr:N-acetylmuramoyl-L-alanine amidase [Synergistaceae bacterium]